MRFLQTTGWFGDVYAEVIGKTKTILGDTYYTYVWYSKDRKERKVDQVNAKHVRSIIKFNMYSIPDHVCNVYFKDKAYNKFNGWVKYESPATEYDTSYHKVNPIPMDDPQNSLKYLMR